MDASKHEFYLLLVEVLSSNVQILKNQKWLLRNVKALDLVEAKEGEAAREETDKVLKLIKEAPRRYGGPP